MVSQEAHPSGVLPKIAIKLSFNLITNEVNMTTKAKEAGQCPVCNSYALDYGDYDWEDNSIGYLFSCADCGAEGTEWYNLVFDEFSDVIEKEVA